MSYIYITDRSYLKKIDDLTGIEIFNIGTEDFYYDKLIKIYSDRDLKIPEKYRKLELKSECEDDTDLSILRSKFIEYCTGYKDVSIITNKDLNSDKCIYTFVTSNEEIYVKIKDYENILEYLGLFSKGDFYISHGKIYADFYHQIFNRSDKELPIKRINDFLYSEDNNHKNNIKNIINDLDLDIYQTSKPEEIEKIFGKEAIYIPKIKIDNFKRNTTVGEMMQGKGDEFLLPSNKDELENFKTVEDNKLPSYPIDENMKLDLSTKLSKINNTIYTPSNIVDMLSDGKVNFINYDDVTNILDSIDDKDINKYSTNDLDVTCSMTDKLEKLNIEYIMIPDIEGYNVFYRNPVPIENDILPKDCKRNMIKNILDNSKSDKNLENYSLAELKNMYYHNGFVFPIDKENMSFVNPYDKSILPLEIVHSYNCGINGIDLENTDPHEKINIDIPVMFNFYNKDKDNIEIELVSPVGKKVISEDFHVKDDQRNFLKNSLFRMWKKGYFLNDYALAYFDKYGKIPKNCIITPWWFKSKKIKNSGEILSFIDQI